LIGIGTKLHIFFLHFHIVLIVVDLTLSENFMSSCSSRQNRPNNFNNISPRLYCSLCCH